MVLKTHLLSFLIAASILSSSFAARDESSIPTMNLGATDEYQESLYIEDDQSLKRDDDDIIHERLLRANTRDYGRSNPAPRFAKPRFKLIPN